MQTVREVRDGPVIRACDGRTNSLVVEFPDGTAYEYTTVSLGESNFAELMRCAQRGDMLDGFVLRALKGRYSRRVH